MNNLFKKISENWYKIYFRFSILLTVFIYGTLVPAYHLPPYKTIHNAKLAFEELFKNHNYRHYAKIRPEKFIHLAKYDGTGVTINDSTKTFDGYTLITSMWNDTSGFKLFDMNGTEIHRWLVSYNSIFPEVDSSGYKLSDWDVDILGAILYPNGDIVFCFNGHGLVKIDKDSKVIWKLYGAFHHSPFRDEDGDLWVPSTIQHNQSVKSYLRLLPPYHEDFICKISSDGEILEKFSLIKVFYDSGMESFLFADGNWDPIKIAHDITHLNDIEILDSSMADMFPLFNTGDIMLSIRQLNLIIIINPENKQIKWSMTGPYIRQHDPDFTNDGKILVFDNQMDNAGGSIAGGSRIIEVDPNTRCYNIVYTGDSNNPFYTNIVGKQQLLPNENILIAEYDGGRVFEITKTGEIIWTFINRYDEDEVYSITDAIRIQKNYLTFID